MSFASLLIDLALLAWGGRWLVLNVPHWHPISGSPRDGRGEGVNK